jgi:hypothetical protein
MGINDLWRLARALECVLKLNLVAACICYRVQNVMVDMSVYIVPWLRECGYLSSDQNKKDFCRRVASLLSLLRLFGLTPHVLVEGFSKYVKERHKATVAAAEAAANAAAAAAGGEGLTPDEIAKAKAAAMVPDEVWELAADLVVRVCEQCNVPYKKCPFEADAHYFHAFYVRDGVFVFVDGTRLVPVKIDAVLTSDSDWFGAPYVLRLRPDATALDPAFEFVDCAKLREQLNLGRDDISENERKLRFMFFGMACGNDYRGHPGPAAIGVASMRKRCEAFFGKLTEGRSIAEPAVTDAWYTDMTRDKDAPSLPMPPKSATDVPTHLDKMLEQVVATVGNLLFDAVTAANADGAAPAAAAAPVADAAAAARRDDTLTAAATAAVAVARRRNAAKRAAAAPAAAPANHAERRLALLYGTVALTCAPILDADGKLTPAGTSDPQQARRGFDMLATAYPATKFAMARVEDALVQVGDFFVLPTKPNIELDDIVTKAIASFYSLHDLEFPRKFQYGDHNLDVSFLEVYLWAAQFSFGRNANPQLCAPSVRRLDIVHAFATHCGAAFPAVPADLGQAFAFLELAEKNKKLDGTLRPVAEATRAALDALLSGTSYSYEPRDDDAEKLLSENRADSVRHINAALARQRQASAFTRGGGGDSSSVISVTSLLAFAPTFFVPIEEVVAQVAPLGYTAEHLTTLFVLPPVLAAESVTLPVPGGRTFFRVTGGTDKVHLDLRDVAPTNARFAHYEPRQACAAPFAAALAARFNGVPGRRMPLRELLELAGPEAEASLPFKGREALLYFAQMQHVFDFAADASGGVVGLRDTATAPRLDPRTTPCPLAFSELRRLLYGKLLDVAAFDADPVAGGGMTPAGAAQLREYFPTSVADFAAAHRALTVLSVDVGDAGGAPRLAVALASTFARRLAMSQGREARQELEQQRHGVKRNLRSLRRRDLRERDPEHPLWDERALAAAIAECVPTLPGRFVTVPQLHGAISREACDRLPASGLLRFLRRHTDVFLLFEMPFMKATCVALAGAELPPGAAVIAPDALSPDEALLLVAATLARLPSRVSTLADLLKRVPPRVLAFVRTVSRLQRLVVTRPDCFVVIQSPDNGTSVRLLRVPGVGQP